MERFWELVDQRLRELSHAEFKVVAYLYRRLGKARTKVREVEISIAELAAATGLSWRTTQAVLQRLSRRGYLFVSGGPGRRTKCRFPAALPPAAVQDRVAEPPVPAPAPARSVFQEGGPVLREAAGVETTPVSKSGDPIKPRTGTLSGDPDREIISLTTKLFRTPDRALLQQLDTAAGGRDKLLRGLRSLAQRGTAFEPSMKQLFLSAVMFECTPQAGR